MVYRSRGEGGHFSYACNLRDSQNSRELFEMLRELAKQEGEELHLHCVSEKEWQLIEEWYPGVYEITYDRDSADYIYLREKLATLSGKKLHGKRNHIHRFEEANSDWCYETICDENEEECAKMAMRWCMNNCMSEQNEIEFDKIDESKLVVYAIRHREELGMIGGALRVNGRIIAITLGEPLTKDTFVVHFEKAFSDIQGAYPMINREFVRHELEEYTYVNREEDMGLEGLRKAKLSYRPEILFAKGQVNPV
jgi:hypothetical protein